MTVANSQGQYEIKVRMGSPYEEVYQRNPNIFEESESGFGPGFMRPNSRNVATSEFKVRILGKDFKPVLDLAGGADDIRLVNSSDIPNAGISNFLIVYPPIMEGEPDEIDRKLYDRYSEIIKQLKYYDWIPYVSLDAARVFGEESWKDINLFRDGYYIDNFEKWKKYKKDDPKSLFFYKDNLLLRFNVGDLTSSVEINTAETDYILMRQEDDRFENWKSYLKKDLVQWEKQRKDEEGNLKSKGIKISEDYVDAPLPPLD